MECENGDNIFYLENLSFAGVYVQRRHICAYFFSLAFSLGLTYYTNHLVELWPQSNCLDVDLHIEHKHCILLAILGEAICLRIKFFSVCAIGFGTTGLWLERKNRIPIPCTNFSCVEIHEQEASRSFCYSQ